MRLLKLGSNPLLLAVSIAAAGMACQIRVGGPEPPAEIIPASAASATELADNWDSALSLDTDEVTLVISEQQLTSFLSERFESDEEPILRHPQVFLRDGEIRIYGTASAGVFEAGALLSIQPIVSSGGDVEFNITTAEFGPVPAPWGLDHGAVGVAHRGLYWHTGLHGHWDPDYLVRYCRRPNRYCRQPEVASNYTNAQFEPLFDTARWSEHINGGLRESESHCSHHRCGSPG